MTLEKGPRVGVFALSGQTNFELAGVCAKGLGCSDGEEVVRRVLFYNFFSIQQYNVQVVIEESPRRCTFEVSMDEGSCV